MRVRAKDDKILKQTLSLHAFDVNACGRRANAPQRKSVCIFYSRYFDAHAMSISECVKRIRYYSLRVYTREMGTS